MLEFLYVAGVGLGSVAVGCLIEKYAPNVGAKWLPEPSPDMVAWRDRHTYGQKPPLSRSPIGADTKLGESA